MLQNNVILCHQFSYPFHLLCPEKIFPSNISHVKSFKSQYNHMCGITKLCISLTNCGSNSVSYDSQNTQRMFPYPALRDRTVYWRRLVFFGEVENQFLKRLFLKKKEVTSIVMCSM